VCKEEEERVVIQISYARSREGERRRKLYSQILFHSWTSAPRLVVHAVNRYGKA